MLASASPSFAASPSASFVKASELSFSASASELLQACKAFEAFRKACPKAYGTPVITGDSCFFSSTGAGLMLQGFAALSHRAFLSWLPSGKLPDAFSLPWLPFFSFVKATKGKGSISYEKGKLSAFPSGASLSLEAGPSLFDHPDQNESWRKESLFLPCFAEKEGSQLSSFPLLPFLSASRFASADESKQALMGASLSTEALPAAFYATDGFSLRKLPVSLPALPMGLLPAEAWLPSWLASPIEACTKAKEREALLGFFQEGKRSAALRFWLPSGLLIALRFDEKPASFPSVEKLFPRKLPFLLSVDHESFSASVDQLLQALKTSEGSPYIQLSFDGCAGSISLSAELFANVGTKKKPELKPMGKQDASCWASFRSFPSDPRFSAGFYEKAESEREALMLRFESESRILVNGFFLQKALKSFSTEGARLSLSWEHEKAPFLLSSCDESLCVIMPVQKRR